MPVGTSTAEPPAAGNSCSNLVRLCLREVDAALGQALWAQDNQRPDVRRRALERAQNGLGALRLGVDRQSPVAPALLTFYEGLAATVAQNQVRFDPARVQGVRVDLADVTGALLGQPPMAA